MRLRLFFLLFILRMLFSIFVKFLILSETYKIYLSLICFECTCIADNVYFENCHCDLLFFLIGCEYQRLIGGCKTTEENCQRSKQENQTV